MSSKIQESENVWIGKLLENVRILEVNLKYGIVNNIIRAQIKARSISSESTGSAINPTTEVVYLNSLDRMFVSVEGEKEVSLKYYQYYFAAMAQELILNSSIENKPWNAIKYTELADYFTNDVF